MKPREYSYDELAYEYQLRLRGHHFIRKQDYKSLMDELETANAEIERLKSNSAIKDKNFARACRLEEQASDKLAVAVEALEWIQHRCETQYAKVNTSVGVRAREALAKIRGGK